MFGAFEQVVQRCWKRKKCWKLVESSLNRFKLSFKIDSTFPLFSKMLNGSFKRFQNLLNIRSPSNERILVKCWNRLKGPLKTVLYPKLITFLFIQGKTHHSFPNCERSCDVQPAVLSDVLSLIQALFDSSGAFKSWKVGQCG